MNLRNTLNGTALLIGLTGSFFRYQEWAGANGLMLVGLGLLFISIVAFTPSDNRAVGVPDDLSQIMVATLIVGIVGAVFKVLNWEGADVVVFIMLLLMVTLTTILIFSKAAVPCSRQFMVVAFVLFTLCFAIMGLFQIEQFMKWAHSPDY